MAILHFHFVGSDAGPPHSHCRSSTVKGLGYSCLALAVFSQTHSQHHESAQAGTARTPHHT